MNDTINSSYSLLEVGSKLSNFSFVQILHYRSFNLLRGHSIARSGFLVFLLVSQESERFQVPFGHYLARFWRKSFKQKVRNNGKASGSKSSKTFLGTSKTLLRRTAAVKSGTLPVQCPPRRFSEVIVQRNALMRFEDETTRYPTRSQP